MSVENAKSGIRNIAHQAGVSTATVSRVLNGSDSVSKATRDRVVEVLKSTRYRPNAAAKALATNRTHTVAAIVPTLRHSIFTVFLNSFEDELARAGYSLVIATHGFDLQTEFRRCNEVLQLGAEAIVVSGANHDSRFLQTFKTAGIPCMFISVQTSKQPFPTFGYDNRLLGKSAVEYLASLGHETIHVIHGPTVNNDRMSDRLEGVIAARKTSDSVELTLHEAELGVEGGSRVSREWFANRNFPHACLCLADVLALGVIFEANRQDVRIPAQMSLMGFENLDWTPFCSPSLTTIALPAAQMGTEAAVALVNCLDDGIALTHRLFEAQIVQRGSTQNR